MKQLRIVVFSLLLVALVMGVACSKTPTATVAPTATAAPKVIEITAQASFPATYIGGKATGEYSGFIGPLYAQWVERMSKGAVKITINAPGTFCQPMDTLKAVSTGAIDAGFLHYPSYDTGIIPDADLVGTVPFSSENVEEAYRLLFDEGLADLLVPLYEKQNVKVFFIADYFNYNLFLNFELKSIDDIKGKKIRTVGMHAELLKALGATTPYTPFAECYMAFKLGTIDGGMAGIGCLQENKWIEVMKSVVVAPVNYAGTVEMIWNMDKWNSLPKELRDTLDEETKYWAFADSARMWWYEETMLREGIDKYGLKVVTLSKADGDKMRQIAYGQWDSILAKKGPAAAKGVEIMKNFHRKLGRPVP